MEVEMISQVSANKMRHTQIFQFLKQHDLGVLSTITQNNIPQSAIVEITPTNFLEIIFATHRESRKHKNLLHNNILSFVVGSYEDISVQFEGFCEEIKNTSEIYQMYAKSLASKMRDNYFPVLDEEDFILYKAIPTWIRYSDVAQKPWDVFEIEFKNKNKERESEKHEYMFPFSFSKK